MNNNNNRGYYDAYLSDETTPVHCHDDKNSYWVGASGREYVGGEAALRAASQDMAPVIEECDEYKSYRNASRRTVLKGAGIGAFLAASSSTRYAFSAANAASNDGNIIVAIFLRGGMDGLGVVAPLGDPLYTKMRPKLGLNDSTLLPLNGGKFGIHPAMPKMAALINSGDATVVHATGHISKSRSHFEKQKFHEIGAMQATMRSGWLGRYLASSGPIPTFRALTMGASSAFMLANPTGPTLAMSSLGDFTLRGMPNSNMSVTAAKISKNWANIGGTSSAAMNTTINASLLAQNYRNVPIASSGFAPGLGSRLADVAKMIKSGAGLEVACVDFDGWDMHGDMGQATGSAFSVLRMMVSSLDNAISAFWNELGPELQKKVTIVTMSEFGRTGSTNGDNGTDHGYGNLMFVVSKGVTKPISGIWPGLDPSSLDGGDLNIVNDYRSVGAELIRKKMNANSTQLQAIFPDYTPTELGIWS